MLFSTLSSSSLLESFWSPRVLNVLSSVVFSLKIQQLKIAHGTTKVWKQTSEREVRVQDEVWPRNVTFMQETKLVKKNAKNLLSRMVPKFFLTHVLLSYYSRKRLSWNSTRNLNRVRQTHVVDWLGASGIFDWNTTLEGRTQIKEIDTNHRQRWVPTDFSSQTSTSFLLQRKTHFSRRKEQYII